MATAKLIFTIIYLIAALAIIVVVLLQEGKSAGLGSLGGVSSNNSSYWDKNKKHSLEGKFQTWTRVTAGLFVLIAFGLMFLK
jgi:preprotein translocase subunit SecG